MREKVIILALLICSSFVFAACPNGMISYWTFDNSSDLGNDDFDGNDGILNADVAYSASGKVNGASVYDGADDAVIVGDEPEFDFGTDVFTLSVWVKGVT